MDFSERLIKVRKEKGLSQEVLAERLGLSRQAISKWETGESKPDLDNLVALCKALDIGVEYLCYGTEPNAEHTAQQTKWNFPKKIILASLIVAIFGAVTFLLGMIAGGRTAKIETENTAAVLGRDAEAVLQTVEIVDVNIVREQEKRLLQILPSGIPEGLEVELLITNINNPETVTVSCIEDGVQFSTELNDLINGFTYRIAAVLKLDGKHKAIPLLRMELDRVYNTFMYEELWR